MQPVNDNSKPNHIDSDKAWFCPACSSADVEASALAGGDARCNVCSWKGQVEDLVTFRFEHDMGSPEQVLHHFTLDIRRFLSKDFAQPILGFLGKWGFLDLERLDSKLAARYVGAIARGIVLSIVQERQRIEKETHGEPRAD